MKKQTTLFDLFFTFFRIGAFTIGGGYAMVPLIQKEVIEHRQWLDTEEFTTLLAIAEMTPGPIAVNTATFVGYWTSGVRGAVAATLGVVLPSFFIILSIAIFLPWITRYPVAERIFYGVRPAVVALIGYAIYNLGRKVLTNSFAVWVALGVFLVQLLLKIPPIPALLLAAGAGILYSRPLEHKRKPED
ncbi:MAG: chromate transporter [Firmicutes bacterium]|nr:chromate transporter [Bacillota bacterium]